MVSMCAALSQIKDDPFRVLKPQVIEQVCQELGHDWREGPLNPVNTVALFVQQVACGNVSCNRVRHFSGRPVSGSAYCQARRRLPLAALQELSRRVADAVGGESGGARFRWRGHRVRVIDGSTFSMPDTAELRRHFGQPEGQAAGCGFPVAHLLALLDLEGGALAEPIASPLYTSDLKGTPAMHRRMGEGELLLGDDTFASWAHFALALRQNLHLLTPSQGRRIVDFTPDRPHVRPGHEGGASKGLPRSRWVKKLGRDDQLVEWFKPEACPPWMSRQEYDALPESVVVREVRRTVRRKGFRPMVVTVTTTLLDPQQYPAGELVKLRLRRWEVETDLRHLKTTMKMDVLRCQSVEGVQKELAVFVLVYNLVRAVMMEAARRQGVAVARVGFADALAWLCRAEPGEALPPLLINPHRPDRAEPRARKRRPKQYALLNRPREQLREELRKGLRNRGKKR